MADELPPLWPHQNIGIDGVMDAVARRVSPIALTAPTGAGKSRIIAEIIYKFVAAGRPAILYSNRRILIDQLSKSLKGFNLDHGIRAAGRRPAGQKLLQIASIQTEDARTLKAPKQIRALAAAFAAGEIEPEAYLMQKHKLEGRATELFHADLAVFDEAHLMTQGAARELIGTHVAAEATVLLPTATPVGLGFAQEMIVAGKASDCRACGATVWATHHGCTEPDFKAMKLKPDADISEAQAVKAIMTTGIFGHVLNHFNKLNPCRLPTLGFAPSVEGSIYFAEEFEKAGIPSCHIDGENIWLRGEMIASTAEDRERVFGMLKRGEIVSLWNRFVLREGIDLPFIRHGILATLFGSLSTYLQACGRFLRADRDPDTLARYGPKDLAVIQDHGGHWWRIGSVNSDWPWKLDLPEHAYVGMRHERIRAGLDPEPAPCPKCGTIMARGRCAQCGVPVKRGRMVLQKNGRLVEHDGPLFAPRREKMTLNTQSLWDRCYWGAVKGKSGMTFMQALGWFVSMHHHWPPRTINHMPLFEGDFYRRARDVPGSKLRRCDNPVCSVCSKGG